MSESSPPQDEDPKNDLSRSVSATRVDMGEDLLEQSAIEKMESELTDSPPAEVGPEQISDLVSSARILLSEGILEEAKRILRQILIREPSQLEARKLLEQVHEIELKQILGGTERSRRRLGRKDPETSIEVSAELVLKDLDRDLNLGLFGENGMEHSARLSLFRDVGAMEAFANQMDREFADMAITDRVDLGVAFLEMGLPELAVRHFAAAVENLRLEPEETYDSLLSATGLLAYAWIMAGRPFDATLTVQAMLAETDVPRERKVDLIYLMGRALEAMGKKDEASGWYSQALEIEPHYRDAEARLRR